jgi:hypothetical protein
MSPRKAAVAEPEPEVDPEDPGPNDPEPEPEPEPEPTPEPASAVTPDERIADLEATVNDLLGRIETMGGRSGSADPGTIKAQVEAVFKEADQSKKIDDLTKIVAELVSRDGAPTPPKSRKGLGKVLWG